MSLAGLSTLPLKRPCSPTLDDPTVRTSPDNALVQKRQRIYESSRCLPPPCPLERLPAEILQQIFFAALNGNLLRASPRIGLKLSTQAVYRTAFIVAFYHQNLADLREIYTYLLPEIPIQIPYWELRSMVKVVLDSRWCTWHWFKELYLDLLGDALARFERNGAAEISETSMETIRSIRDRSADCCDLAGTGIHGRLKDGRTVELDCDPYYICISEYPAKWLEDSIGKTPEVVATIQWRLLLFAFGTIPMDVRVPRCSECNKRPFRESFKAVFDLYGSSSTRYQDDLWACRERCIFGAVQENDIPTLRRSLQIDYFFYPEDVPYKISPNLFRTAVKNEDRDGTGAPAMSALAVLFDLDPYSLPYDSDYMKEWAQDTFERICEQIGERSQEYSYFKERQAGDNPYSEGVARDFVKQRRVEAYMGKTYRDIIRYMRDGVVREEKNLLSPSFQGPVFNDDVETFMSEEEQSISATMPTRQSYLNMTVPALRDELSHRDIRPYSVGRRKADYVDRLMREDQEGNTHQAWLEDDDCFGDEDLESLLDFVRTLRHGNSYPTGSSIYDWGTYHGDMEDTEEEDVYASDEESQASYASYYNPNLDYVPELLDRFGDGFMADKKEDYVWFKEVE